MGHRLHSTWTLACVENCSEVTKQLAKTSEQDGQATTAKRTGDLQTIVASGLLKARRFTEKTCASGSRALLDICKYRRVSEP